MKTELTLLEQRKKLNQIFDAIISHPNLSEQEFDKAMQEWISANKKLEAKEEPCNLVKDNVYFTNATNTAFY